MRESRVGDDDEGPAPSSRNSRSSSSCCSLTGLAFDAVCESVVFVTAMCKALLHSFSSLLGVTTMLALILTRRASLIGSVWVSFVLLFMAGHSLVSAQQPIAALWRLYWNVVVVFATVHLLALYMFQFEIVRASLEEPLRDLQLGLIHYSTPVCLCLR